MKTHQLSVITLVDGARLQQATASGKLKRNDAGHLPKPNRIHALSATLRTQLTVETLNSFIKRLIIYQSPPCVLTLLSQVQAEGRRPCNDLGLPRPHSSPHPSGVHAAVPPAACRRRRDAKRATWRACRCFLTWQHCCSTRWQWRRHCQRWRRRWRACCMRTCWLLLVRGGGRVSQVELESVTQPCATADAPAASLLQLTGQVSGGTAAGDGGGRWDVDAGAPCSSASGTGRGVPVAVGSRWVRDTHMTYGRQEAQYVLASVLRSLGLPVPAPAPAPQQARGGGRRAEVKSERGDGGHVMNARPMQLFAAAGMRCLRL